MRPILFDKNATTFNSNGIGRLECLSCIVTEERNGLYELEMVVPENGLHVSEIEPLSIIVARHDDSDDLQPFRVYEVRNLIKGKVTVYAHHISYQLSNIPTMPFNVYAKSTACQETLNKLKSNAVEDCPFSFWTDVVTVASYQQETPATIWQRLKGIAGSVLDQFGGEYEWDKWTVKLHRFRGVQQPDVSLRYGKNIIDLDQEKNIASTVTGVCPFWIDMDGNMVTLPEKTVDSRYAELYPFKRTIPLDLSQYYEEQPSEDQLRATARSYVNKNGIGIPKVSIKVSFINLWQTEEYKDVAPLQRVKLCDYVGIDFERLGIHEEAKVVKTQYDVLNERYASMELGSIRSSFATTITDMSGALTAEITRNNFEIKKTADILRYDIDNATAWLTGSNGYVMAVKNPDGTWKELLFLDSPDAEAAIRVLRVNENGLGFSSTGIHGPYTQAWTLDGKLVIGGTNVPSLTVYTSRGTILFRVSRSGIQWELPNSVMTENGSLTITSGNVNAATLTGTVSSSAKVPGSTINGALSSLASVPGSILTGTINGLNVNVTNINGGNIRTGTIAALAIATGAITTDKLAANSITAAKIQSNAVTTDKLSANAVTAQKISSGAITTEKLSANAVTTDKLSANAVTAQKISSGAITTDKLDAGAVTAQKISSGAVTADKIQAGSISSDKISAYGISANVLTSGSIDANYISVRNLSAEDITTGTFSGDRVSGGSIRALGDLGFEDGSYFTCREREDGWYILACHTQRFKVWGTLVSEGTTRPGTDNSYNCGSSSHRWANVYARNDEIQTSDENEKHDVNPISKPYEELFFKIKPVTYMFNNGDRVHMGAIAQQVEESMEEVGLTAEELAALCKDPKIQTQTIVKDGEEEEVEIPVTKSDGTPEYSYGLRYGELSVLTMHMLQKAYKRIEELETRIAALEAKEG